MEIIFKIQNDGSPPLVNIDGKRLAVVQLTYAWRTKNIDPDSGTNICIIDGFFEESNILQRFVYDIKDNIVTVATETNYETEYLKSLEEVH